MRARHEQESGHGWALSEVLVSSAALLLGLSVRGVLAGTF
jgi:hypothetical protein